MASRFPLMKTNLFRVIKIVFIVLLMAAFLFTMARPSISKFLERAVMVEFSMIPEAKDGHPMVEAVTTPAITFCPYKDLNAGWNTEPLKGNVFSDFVMTFCNSSLMQDVLDCVRNNTFSFEESLKDAKFNMQERFSVMNESLWRTVMDTVYYGTCHTFQYSDKVYADMVYDGFLFYLDPSLNYRVIFHDPKFYHIVSNTMTFPRMWLEYKSGQNMKPGHYEWYYITVTEHHMLNRPEQPCQEEKEYDFLKCVKTSQARRVGCRPPWDSWSPRDVPLCERMEELQEHERLDWADVNLEQKMIVNNSGCELPCHYREYQVAGEPQGGPAPAILKRDIGDSLFMLGYNFVSTDIRSEKEAWVYPLVSFIAELGGSLGLFVGFSFLTIWDCLDFALARYKRYQPED